MLLGFKYDLIQREEKTSTKTTVTLLISSRGYRQSDSYNRTVRGTQSMMDNALNIILFGDNMLAISFMALSAAKIIHMQIPMAVPPQTSHLDLSIRDDAL